MKKLWGFRWYSWRWV